MDYEYLLVNHIKINNGMFVTYLWNEIEISDYAASSYTKIILYAGKCFYDIWLNYMYIKF